MKSYRCVFNYAGGNTTIDIAAADGEQALTAAASAINAGDYDGVEVWEGDSLLIARTTPRAWDCLGGPAADSAAEIAEASPPPVSAPNVASLPRRAPTLFISSLRALGAKTGWRNIVSRRTKA